MIPPLVSFVTWIRMGLTIRNLTALLGTSDDFDLHIVDSNSMDGTWSYLQSLKDNRIKSVTKFDYNMGPVYATNYNLSKRKRNQYFIAFDSDVNIHTKDWTGKFMEVFEAFPKVGLLGAVTKEYYDRYRLPLVKRENKDTYYLELCKGFVEGCCQCLRPELLDILGYWSEENCVGDMEISFRIQNCTSFKAGFLPAVEIDQLQLVSCNECSGHKYCKLDHEELNCFGIRDKKYQNPQFRTQFSWKYRRFIDEIRSGKREPYCASIHDEESMKNHYYNMQMANENFDYYIKNAN